MNQTKPTPNGTAPTLAASHPHTVSALRIVYKTGRIPYGHSNYTETKLGEVTVPDETSFEDCQLAAKRAFPNANAFQIRHPNHGFWACGSL